MRPVLAALIVASLVAPAAASGKDGPDADVITRSEATRVFLAHPKVERWLARYERGSWLPSTSFSSRSKTWEVKILSGVAGQIAGGRVGRSGKVLQAFVGPEVAWTIARGGGLGGAINRPFVWLGFCALFLLLGNSKRLLSAQNLDLLALLSLSVYLAFFNTGHVFASAVAAASSLLYLMARCTWIGVTNRISPAVPLAPTWLLVGILVFVAFFRIGLDVKSAHTLDISYAGVIGADRLVNGTTPYGNFPRAGTGRRCGPAQEDGKGSEWIQDNGRCETANHLGDTYGPVNYHAYVPGLWLFGWTGKWDYLPAARFTTILFDTLALLGLAAIGFRYGGSRLAVTLAFAWVAYPFTQYASSSTTNDSIMAAAMIWGVWAATSNAGRGGLLALAAWTKLAALVVVPLWLTYPARKPRGAAVFATAFAATTALSFWVLLAGGNPLHELDVFYERTFEIQAQRSSPFSLWDWGDYHAGLPDLKWLQRVLQVVLVGAALILAVIPRRKSPLQLVAFTAVLLMGFELLLTHWTATYVVWFFPFVLLATFAGDRLQQTKRRLSNDGSCASIMSGSV